MADLEPLYTTEEMRAAEAGHDVDQMMRRAGGAVADELVRSFPDARRIALHAGGGANGGDGRIAAEILRARGRELVDERPDVLIDALLGTGLKGEPREETSRLIEQINGAGVPVLAVDVPSGLDASSGEVAGAAVRADVTVTMHGPKVGLAVGPGRFHAGEVPVADIGLAAEETSARLVTEEILLRVPRKQERDNKYSAGSVLVVGGSRGMTGAAALAARAAFRGDAGYVAIAAPSESLPTLETLVLEAVKRPLEQAFEATERATALAIGPGLGRGEEAKALVRRLLEELGRLIGEESSWVDAHRLEALARAVERFGCVVLLKGADTLVGAPGEGVLVRAVNDAGLATAGTGDVLTGITAAFLSKGLDARIAAAAAATAHGLAASLAPQRRGLVASDVVEALPLALARHGGD
jgi:NAD(P)H-hydrate repair Nnr-like enzyme with NAD(P)H-hydrate dehydratase domain/NAD(P)H-hydrate repair Nnr-like enzyme with NAD(P)H-hydrate epimerase domain